MAGCSHQIWSGQVSGHAPRKFWKLRGYEIASGTIFEPKQCFSEGRRQSFTCMNIHPFSLLCHIALGSAFQSFANLTNADEACETNHSLGRAESWWKTRRDSFTLFAAISSYVQHVTMLCVCHRHSPSIGPILQHQASHGRGKKLFGWNQTKWTGSYGPVRIRVSLETVAHKAAN